MDRIISETDKDGNTLLELNLDGRGALDAPIDFSFLQHMLEAFCRHGLFDLKIAPEAIGSPASTEAILSTVGRIIGSAFADARDSHLQEPASGHFTLPMDDVLVRTSLDLYSDESNLNYRVKVKHSQIRSFNLHQLEAFFQAFTEEAGINLHIHLVYGKDPHHAAEAVFKCFARALYAAIEIRPPQASESLWQRLKTACR